MNEHPILFSGEMVNAILTGKKTQTRRVIKSHPLIDCRMSDAYIKHPDNHVADDCRYGRAGDRLWVRETWRAEELPEFGEDGIRYKADDHFQQIENTREASEAWGEAYREGGHWRPSIFMPRWASRITLEIVSVRVERVQEISNDDVWAEGITMHSAPRKNDPLPTPRSAYAALWDKLNSSRGYGWAVNPWVWVIEVKPLSPLLNAGDP